jgi:hypothetical protein
MEIINPVTGQPAQPGQVGSLVLTPYAPYREAVVVLRYYTQDLARALDKPLDCSQKHFPAAGPVLGKKRYAIRHAQGWSCPREVLEAIEAVDEIPLPARCSLWAMADGVAVQVVVPYVNEALRRRIEASFQAHGVPLRGLYLTTEQAQLTKPLPLRSDWAESSFAANRETNIDTLLERPQVETDLTLLAAPHLNHKGK